MELPPIKSADLAAFVDARDRMVAAVRVFAREYHAAQLSAKALDVRSPSVSLESYGRDLHLTGFDDASRLDAFVVDSVRAIDATFWDRLFDASHLRTLMTRQHQAKLWDQLRGERGEKMPDFTRENIEATFSNLHARAEELFEDSVEAVFRSMSWDHVTNLPAKFRPRMILRGCLFAGSVSWDAPVLDLERVLLLISRRPPPNGNAGLRAVRGDLPLGEWFDAPAPDGGSSVLAVKAHLCGTLHVRADSAVIDAMNRVMARRAGSVLADSPRRRQAR